MNKRAQRKLDRQQQPKKNINDPWISMRNGIIIMTIVSIGLVAYITYQALQNPANSFAQSLQGGLVMGGMLWVIFVGLLLANRYIFRRGDRNSKK